MNSNDIAATLAKHQRQSQGMTSTSPDICLCGERVMPDKNEEDVEVRRNRAFAEHQSAMLPTAARPKEPRPLSGDEVLRLQIIWSRPDHGLDAYNDLVAVVERIKLDAQTPDEPMPFAVPGHCVTIDGEWWHEMGSCLHGSERKPCCGLVER